MYIIIIYYLSINLYTYLLSGPSQGKDIYTVLREYTLLTGTAIIITLLSISTTPLIYLYYPLYVSFTITLHIQVDGPTRHVLCAVL